MYYEFPIYQKGTQLTLSNTLYWNCIRAVACAYQVPLSMAVSVSIPSIAALSQMHVDVKMPINSGVIVPTSFNMLTLAESGSKKTPLNKFFTKELHKLETENFKKWEKQIAKYNLYKEFFDQQTKNLKKELYKTKNQESASRAFKRLMEHLESEPLYPKLKQIIFEDTTFEAMFESMTYGNINIYLNSGEAGIAFNSPITRHTSKLNNIDSGDVVLVNRKSGGSARIEGSRISINFLSQMKIFQDFLDKTNSFEDGFWNRFLVNIAEDFSGSYYYVETEEHSSSMKMFHDRQKQILNMNLAENRKVMYFSDEAKQIWFDVERNIQYNKGPNQRFSYIKGYANKLSEKISRLAAALQFFETPNSLEITTEILIDAIHITSYFTNDFMEIFSEAPLPVKVAENIFKQIVKKREQGVRYIRRNSLLQSGAKYTRKAENRDEGLSILESYREISIFYNGKTVCIDLMPWYLPDEVKMKIDLGL